MKKIFTFLFVFAAFVGVISAQQKNGKVVKSANVAQSLAASLPKSDAVVSLDMKRLMIDALPQILVSKPKVFADINTELENVKTKFGIDLRQFEQVAVGITMKKVSDKEIDFEPLILARGKYNAGALIALAKIAANGKYREETIGEKTIYIFQAKEILNEQSNATNNSQIRKMLKKAINSLPIELAVTSFDENTLTLGTVARVRETFNSNSKVSAEVLGLAEKNGKSILSFGAVMSQGLSFLLPLDNDELGQSIDSIRQMSGSLDVKMGNAVLAISAKTLEAKQAQSLEETFLGLQMLGQAFISGNGEDKKVYARMVDNAKITRNLNEVMIDLQVPQTDIAILIK
ncbi:MAG: hypothetical protein MUC29_04820 [Pyrinomonadaceae bacterium]|jgi:hypothetical protein|nr:hypothetical protein [Pyrinomonadaceae bacterium]